MEKERDHQFDFRKTTTTIATITITIKISITITTIFARTPIVSFGRALGLVVECVYNGSLLDECLLTDSNQHHRLRWSSDMIPFPIANDLWLLIGVSTKKTVREYIPIRKFSINIKCWWLVFHLQIPPSALVLFKCSSHSQGGRNTYELRVFCGWYCVIISVLTASALLTS